MKVTDELEIESLGWFHGGEFGGGELTMGWNQYKPIKQTPNLCVNFIVYTQIECVAWYTLARITIKNIWIISLKISAFYFFLAPGHSGNGL